MECYGKNDDGNKDRNSEFSKETEKSDNKTQIHNSQYKQSEEGTAFAKTNIHTSVGKIDVYARSRRKIAVLAHTLKRLSHEGKMERFNEIVTAVNDRCMETKLKMGKCVCYMEISDLRFTTLDAQIEARRLKYDTSLKDSDIFVQMERLIVYTSNPTASSMTYLARLGSALSMKTTLDDGLAYLQFAEQHSECISPCKDTGMVYYIKVNLLTQKFEHDPSAKIKKEIIQTIEHAISQFCNEEDDIRKDYTRMLMLKMSYCYLGLSLFGKRIKEVTVSENDRNCAKNCFDIIESPDIWERMESRRKMLYYIAKAEYYRQEKIYESSLIHAKEAEKIAQDNSWTAELPNIKELVCDIESTFPEHSIIDKTGDEIIEDLLCT